MAKSKKRSVDNAYLDVALAAERVTLPVSTVELLKALNELDCKLKSTGLIQDSPKYAKQTKRLLRDFKYKLLGGVVVDSFGHELKQGDFFLLLTKDGKVNPDWEVEYYSIAGKQPVVSSLYPIDKKITSVFALFGDHRDTYLAMETAVYHEELGNPSILKPAGRLNLTTLECLAVNAVKIFPPTVRK